ncbi:sugar ABC transporter permease [Paenibacillus alginolyticus]|uniref:Sugar ABC transporter permease n=1 Tax=Paenibacillus alginolyticus TaxID=59839 RepID=A0ABT4GM26_9BACL|nr:sugar ABC transporter permease [Paenibacillus alginolyticus]MCY9667980.1 sugar ABC transporter permease [Paenibacillus alginolyticus]MCY9697242.1 sugar ABC transporter permease [Paenibacillus alginolyticus]MEC0145495.1 sugar ABC transporter permease [Paenibacillus alginolyticus]
MSLSKQQKRRSAFAYFMIAPGMILLIAFTFYPIVYGLPLAFTNYSAVDTTKWIGMKNFNKAFHDPDFLVSLKNSLIYVVVVPVIQILAILMAVLVNTKLKFVNFFRVAYFIPVVTSMVAAAIAWKWMYEEKGILNYILLSLGLIKHEIAFMVEPSLTLAGVMLVTIWKGLGYYMMIYLAGLQTIPSEIQESARIDGANRSQVIRHITIPLLMPFVLLCSLLSVMGAIRVFDEIFVMHGPKGDPVNSTLVTSVYSYKVAFQDFNFGYAAAVGLVVALIILVFSLIMFRYTRKGGLTYYE